MSVADLLTASRAAHAEYRANAGKIRKDGSIADLGNVALARNAVQHAYDTRRDAHAADPEHADPAWAADKVSHDELTKFYERYLA